MRAVDRGEVPKIDGQSKVYSRFRDANADLEKRLGKYCCYCERFFASMLEVEHLSPKSRERAGLNDWDNFLLSCKICNTVKLAKPTNDEDFLWPDRDNTFCAFDYRDDGSVAISSRFTENDPNRTRAANLMKLVGLDRHQEDGWPDPTDRDCRWDDREITWRYAERTKRKFSAPTDDDAEYIANGASLIGFFSVWMSVFHDAPLVRRALIDAFKGTASDCFDVDGSPVKRQGGRI